MWILHFFADGLIEFITHAVLLTGIVSCVLTFAVLNRLLMAVPVLASYYQALRAVSVALLVLGVYLEGGLAAEQQWRERVQEMETKAALAQQQAQHANKTLAAAGKEKIKVIREKGIVVKQYIDREVVKYNNTCAIPESVVKAHNAAAKNEELK